MKSKIHEYKYSPSGDKITIYILLGITFGIPTTQLSVEQNFDSIGMIILALLFNFVLFDGCYLLLKKIIGHDRLFINDNSFVIPASLFALKKKEFSFNEFNNVKRLGAVSNRSFDFSGETFILYGQPKNVSINSTYFSDIELFYEATAIISDRIKPVNSQWVESIYLKHMNTEKNEELKDITDKIDKLPLTLNERENAKIEFNKIYSDLLNLKKFQEEVYSETSKNIKKNVLQMKRLPYILLLISIVFFLILACIEITYL